MAPLSRVHVLLRITRWPSTSQDPVTIRPSYTTKWDSPTVQVLLPLQTGCGMRSRHLKSHVTASRPPKTSRNAPKIFKVGSESAWPSSTCPPTTALEDGLANATLVVAPPMGSAWRTGSPTRCVSGPEPAARTPVRRIRGPPVLVESGSSPNNTEGKSAIFELNGYLAPTYQNRCTRGQHDREGNRRRD